jgi:hypothetical protein
MALEAIKLTLTPRAVPPSWLDGRELLRRTLEAWQESLFRPSTAAGSVGSERIELDASSQSEAEWSGVPLCPGEQVIEGTPLTVVNEQGEKFANTLLERVAPSAAVLLTMHGPLYHLPPLAGAREGWYGRMLAVEEGESEGVLWDLARLAVRWRGDWQEVSLQFPIAGYPLTHQVPLMDPTWHILSTDDHAAVEVNRERIVAAAAALVPALGLSSEAVDWTVNAEDALDVGDRAALAIVQARLQSGGN